MVRKPMLERRVQWRQSARRTGCRWARPEDDLPAQFACDVAQSLDQHKGIFIWSIITFSYNPDTVWQVKDVPLHPGAARCYHERGYMK